MATPTVNVPPAELMKSFIERALKSPYADHTMLVVLKPPLLAAVVRMDGLIGGTEKGTAYDTARANTRAADETFDNANRFGVKLLEALAAHPDGVIRGAAEYLLAYLFPERLAVIQLAFELEAASATSFAKRLAQPQAQASIATLTAEVPKLADHLQAVVQAALALGQALEALDGVLVDKAGRPIDPALFAARSNAQHLFARFVDVVETFAYPDDTPDHAQARTALIGPYRRFLSANTNRSEAPAEPAVAPTPAPTA